MNKFERLKNFTTVTFIVLILVFLYWLANQNIYTNITLGITSFVIIVMGGALVRFKLNQKI